MSETPGESSQKPELDRTEILIDAWLNPNGDNLVPAGEHVVVEDGSLYVMYVPNPTTTAGWYVELSSPLLLEGEPIVHGDMTELITAQQQWMGAMREEWGRIKEIALLTFEGVASWASQRSSAATPLIELSFHPGDTECDVEVTLGKKAIDFNVEPTDTKETLLEKILNADQ